MRLKFKGYFINKSGQVFNKFKKKMKPYVSGNKYRVKLGMEDYDLQSLVAQLFIENPEAYRHIEAIDGNLKNVRSDNLKWSLHPQRKKHTKSVGLDHYKSTFTKKDVETIKSLLDEGHLTQSEIAEKFDTKQSTISKIKNGWTHKD
jgi:hypothetical protein|tara:strand:- start:205 stop:642 length:438 start_codon:yes stop_codon:yes gene_type:complete